MDKSSKVKLFIENFMVYGIGGIMSKIIPFIMIPIITRIMPNSGYFGISDLSVTLVSFGSALAVMGMYDAMYRMFFEKENEQFKRQVCSTAMAFTIVTSIVVFFIMLFLQDWIAKIFFSDSKYANVVYLSAMATLVSATNLIVAAPTRMQNKRRIFLIANTVSPLLSYGVAVPMLLKGYYVIALPLANVISGASIELVFYLLNRKWFSMKSVRMGLMKDMLKIAIPLLPNFLIYWIFNSSDKVMITNILGIGDAGIYSVGSKLGHASQLIYTAFVGGWQYFAFATMKEDNQVKTNSLVFEYLGIISFCATTFICAWSYIIYDVLFEEEYLLGYIIAPYLFLAPLLQMLYQVISNQFLVIKKTWPVVPILGIGAVVNVVLNLYLIPILGIEGASIATLLGYVVSDIICVIVLYRIELIDLSGRFAAATILMAVYFLVWRFFFSRDTIAGTVFAIVTSGVFVWLYRKEVKQLLNRIKKV